MYVTGIIKAPGQFVFEDNLPQRRPDSPTASAYEIEVGEQLDTLRAWSRGELTAAELRDRFRAHAAALLAGDPL